MWFKSMKFNPNDPSSIYRMAGFYAILGACGSYFGRLFFEFLDAYMYTVKLPAGCTSQSIRELVPECIHGQFVRRLDGQGYYTISHIITVLCDLLLVVAFFLMEDMYSRQQSATNMRDFLTIGVVLRCMDNAFRIGIRSAAGKVSQVFRPLPTGNPYTTLEMSYRLLQGSLQWVSTLRRIAFALGVYMASHYDKLENIIGPTWQVVGFIVSGSAVIACICDIGKLLQNTFFINYAGFFGQVFITGFAIWMIMFGVKCRKLSAGTEGEADTSGSEMSDDETTAQPAAFDKPVSTASLAVEKPAEEIEVNAAETEKKKKRKRKTKKEGTAEPAEAGDGQEGSDDDV